MLDVVHMGHLRPLSGRAVAAGSSSASRSRARIVIKPQVLLLDEPLSNLDANLREEMRFEIRRLHDEFRITTVYVTHDQAEAMVTSDRIAVMNQGRIEQVDDPHTLYTRPKTRFVAGFIGRTNFIEGTVNGARDRVRSLRDAARARSRTRQASGKVTFSVRPQSMRLSRAQSANGQPQVAVTIVERAIWASSGTMSWRPRTARCGCASPRRRSKSIRSARAPGSRSIPSR